ncbi:MAG: hypothetical protein HY080_02905 [Gammaproteobacteria bacterium]|nr:hypothetical protein [Gammaproteobacteria bacterium]
MSNSHRTVSSKGKILLKSMGFTFLISLFMTGVHAQGEVANVVQLHIRLKAQAHTLRTPLTIKEAADLSSMAGVILTPMVETSDNAHIVGLPRAMTRAEAWAIATQLSAQPDIDAVEPIDPEFHQRPPTKPNGLPH